MEGMSELQGDNGGAMKFYKYGMRLRGFSIGCQPSGVVKRLDDETNFYYDIIVYDRELADKEVSDYELDYLGESDEI